MLPASPVEPRPWRVRDALVALLVGLATAVVASLLVGLDPSVLALFGFVVPAQSVGTLLAIAFMARSREDWRWALAARVELADGWGLLIGAGLQLGLSLIAYTIIVEVLGWEVPSQEILEAADDAIGGLEGAVVGFAVVLLGPIAEETVFRGVMLGVLRHRYGDARAVVVSAAAFAVFHLLDPNAAFGVPFFFVLGLVMGRAVVRTGRLGRAITIHAGFNLVTLFAIYLV